MTEPSPDKMRFVLTILRERLRRLFLENAGLKALSLLIAIVLWMAVSSRHEGSVTLRGIRVEFQNRPSGLEISEVGRDTVNIKLQGPNDIIRSLRPEQLEVIADLSHMERGARVVLLGPENVIVPPGVRVLDIEPPRIPITLEQVVSKVVPIEPSFEGKVASGFELLGYRLEPTATVIQGPESHLNPIGKAMTETIWLSGRASSFTTRVAVSVKDARVEIIGNQSVDVRVEIGEVRRTVTLADIPVHLTSEQKSIHLVTRAVNVTLEGPKSIVESLKPADISISLDTGELGAGTHRVVPLVSLPPGARDQIKVKSIEPEKVTLVKRR